MVVVWGLNEFLFGKFFNRFFVAFHKGLSFVKTESLLFGILLFTELFDAGIIAHYIR